MNEMVSVPQVPHAGGSPPQRVFFTGKRADFRRLVTRGALLELITLGFYRFWLTTDMRRHMWSHTVVDGDASEYTGRARELLIGFLIAMAILIPVYLGYFLISLEAERMQDFASFPLILFTYLFGQFAIYRARRYRMSRTVWRGVRFWMTGSGWAYAFRAFGWGILTVVTLGLALPWRDAALERYKTKHSHYGSAPGEFTGRGAVFFKRGFVLWLLSMILLAASIALPFLMYYGTANGSGTAMEAGIMAAIGIGISMVMLFIASPFLWGAYKSIQWRWWIEGLRFGGVEAQSNLRAGALIGLYWGVIGWIVLLALACGAAMAAIGGALMGFSEQAMENAANDPVAVIAMLVAYILFIVAINVVLRLYLIRDLWQRVVSSVTVTGLDSVRDVAAKGELAGALGEGFADGLDVGGF